MAIYNYNKYTVKSSYPVDPSLWPWTYYSTQNSMYGSSVVNGVRIIDPYDNGRDDFFFQTYGSFVDIEQAPNGTFGYIHSESIGHNASKYIKIADRQIEHWGVYMQDMDVSLVKSAGDFVSSLQAENGTYPSNGIHTDGYWYVRGNMVNNPPTVPGTFINPIGTLEIGDSKSISWGASSDSEGGIINYQLEVSVDGGTFTTLKNNTSLSHNYTIPNVNTIKFRVKAIDNGGLSSAYRESNVFNVSKPLYYWNKYNVNTPYALMPLNVPPNDLGGGSYNAWDSYTINSTDGTVLPSGNLITIWSSIPSGTGWARARDANPYIVNKYVVKESPEDPYYNTILAYSYSPTRVEERGILVQSGIQAIEGTYPLNGKHTDGYWYVRGSRVNNSIPPTGAFTKPIIGTILLPNQVIEISFGASSIPTSLYEIDYKYNSGTWNSLPYNSSTTRTLTITSDESFTNVEFRVRAKDSNVYSDYVYSDKFIIQHNQLPTLNLSTLNNLILNENSSFTINGSMLEPDNGNVVAAKYQINDNNIQTILSATSDGSTQIPFNKSLIFKGSKLYDDTKAVTTSLSSGTDHILKVWSEDNKGGKSTEFMRTFTVIPVVKNKLNPSITVNPNNEVFIIYENHLSESDTDIAALKNINGNWTKENIISTGSKEISPSTLYDPTYSIDFKGPSFIYENVTEKRVGYYGEWEVPIVDYSKLPNMLDLDGIDDYLKIREKMIPKDDDFTIEFFFKTNTKEDSVIFQISEKITNYSQLVVSMKDGKLELWVKGLDTITESQDTYNDGKLYHAVIRKTGSLYELIIDGVRVVSRVQNTIFAENCYITIGACTDEDGNKDLFYEGQISPPRFWDDPRTIKELVDYKDIIVPDDEQGLIDYFIYDPTTGNLVGKKTGIPIERHEATWTSKFVSLPEASEPYPLKSQKTENINKLRRLVNQFRKDNGLEEYMWTDPIIIPKVTVIKAIHWNELQSATLEVYSVTGEVLYNEKVKKKLEEIILPRNTRYRIDGLGERISNIIQALRNEDKGGS